MKNQFKTIAAVLALGMVGYAAYAETVTVSTFYPSPYGSYQTLETTALQGAAGTGNIWVVPASGNVGIGVANGAALGAGTKLDVRGGRIHTTNVAAGGTNNTAYLEGAAAGVFIGGLGNQPVSIGNVTEGNAVLVVDGGNVRVNGIVTGDLRLEDSASSPANNNPGVLQVICENPPGNRCYAVAVYS